MALIRLTSLIAFSQYPLLMKTRRKKGQHDKSLYCFCASSGYRCPHTWKAWTKSSKFLRMRLRRIQEMLAQGAKMITPGAWIEHHAHWLTGMVLYLMLAEGYVDTCAGNCRAVFLIPFLAYPSFHYSTRWYGRSRTATSRSFSSRPPSSDYEH